MSARPLVITVEDPATGLAWTYEFETSPVLLGRDAHAVLRVDRPYVSGQHGRFAFDDDTIVYEDLGSRGGTLVDDRPAPVEREVPLTEASTLRIGPLVLRVSREATAAPPVGAVSPFATGPGAPIVETDVASAAMVEEVRRSLLGGPDAERAGGAAGGTAVSPGSAAEAASVPGLPGVPGLPDQLASRSPEDPAPVAPPSLLASFVGAPPPEHSTPSALPPTEVLPQLSPAVLRPPPSPSPLVVPPGPVPVPRVRRPSASRPVAEPRRKRSATPPTAKRNLWLLGLSIVAFASGAGLLLAWALSAGTPSRQARSRPRPVDWDSPTPAREAPPPPTTESAPPPPMSSPSKKPQEAGPPERSRPGPPTKPRTRQRAAPRSTRDGVPILE